jgi:hypothetical protein
VKYGFKVTYFLPHFPTFSHFFLFLQRKIFFASVHVSLKQIEFVIIILISVDGIVSKWLFFELFSKKCNVLEKVVLFLHGVIGK